MIGINKQVLVMVKQHNFIFNELVLVVLMNLGVGTIEFLTFIISDRVDLFQNICSYL